MVIVMAILQNKLRNFGENFFFHDGDVEYLEIFLFYHTAYMTVKKILRLTKKNFPSTKTKSLSSCIVI